MLTNMFLVCSKVSTKNLHFDSVKSLFLKKIVGHFKVFNQGISFWRISKFFTKKVIFGWFQNIFYSYKSFFQKKILENFTEKCSVENELSASYNSIIQSEALINLANPNVFGPIKRFQS